MSWVPRRFWASAAPRAVAEGFAVLLDDRPLVTPAKRRVVVPTQALAAALADEWNAVEAEVRPELLPFTRAVNSAIDRVAPNPAPVVAAVAAYGGSDLLCYRAEEPVALVARQFAAWEPWLAWARLDLGAPLLVVSGVMHHAQPDESLARLTDAVADHGPFALTALHDLVALSGSLVLGLAVSRGVLDAAQAWTLSRIDEDWQAEQWGRDREAEIAAEARKADFLRAGLLLRLLA